ncbi:MAG: toxin-antitoxin system YwqK family antitoxin [Bacteroidia bacterium]|nr:toxin-antitoxin system YwqK family antitoxin [Bacteroidia bacterium]
MQYSNIPFFIVAALLIFGQNGLRHLEEKVETGPTVVVDSLNLIPAKGLVFHRNEAFTGLAIDSMEDGTLVEETEYLEGKRQGTLRKWFPNGQLSYEAFYENGKLHGQVRSWWTNGNLRSLNHYQTGELHGEQWQWYKSGAKFKKRLLEMGREEGLQQCWRENGKIYNNYEAKNGRIFGLKRANLCYRINNEIVQFKTK